MHCRLRPLVHLRGTESALALKLQSSVCIGQIGVEDIEKLRAIALEQNYPIVEEYDFKSDRDVRSSVAVALLVPSSAAAPSPTHSHSLSLYVCFINGYFSTPRLMWYLFLDTYQPTPPAMVFGCRCVHGTSSQPSSPDLPMRLKSSVNVRPYQAAALTKMFGSNGRCRSGIVVLPCGAGKTLVGIAACANIRKRTIVFCNNNETMNQWCRSFKHFTTVDESKLKQAR